MPANRFAFLALAASWAIIAAATPIHGQQQALEPSDVLEAWPGIQGSSLTERRTTAEGSRASTFAIDWSSVDGGGLAEAAGGEFRLTGSLGQPDAGQMSGPAFSLAGGFLALPFYSDPTLIFEDGFESGNTTAWTLEKNGSKEK